MKKLLICGLIFGLFFFATSVSAAGWENYYVKAAGPYETGFAGIGQLHLIKLEPVSGGSAIYFRLKADRAKEFLAVALTAQSLDTPVRAFIEQLYSNGHWSDYVVTSMFMGATVDDLT